MSDSKQQALVEKHMGLVRGIAGKIFKTMSQHVEYDDLVGFGMTGLLEAANRFDESVGVAFSSFAYYRVRGSIYDGLRSMGHIPRSEYAKHQMAQKATDYLENLDRSERAKDKVNKEQGVDKTADAMRTYYEAIRSVATVFVTSLDAHWDAGKQVVDNKGGNPQKEAAYLQLRDQIMKAVKTLPEKEQHFIMKCYFEGASIQEAGIALGLSKSWSSRVHARAIDKLKKKLAEYQEGLLT